MQINSYSKTNFKAIKVATAQNLIGNQKVPIEIYKLTSKDKGFLEALLKKIDYKKRLPNSNEYEQKVWGDIFKYSVYNALERGNSSYIALSANKPCGIMCSAQNKVTNLIGICAIPDKNGKKTPLVGTTLFYQLFSDAIKNNTKTIKLEAVNDSPIDVIKKYLSLGFKKTSAEGRYTKMEINHYKIKEQLNQLKNTINFTTCKQAEVNLEKTLD